MKNMSRFMHLATFAWGLLTGMVFISFMAGRDETAKRIRAYDVLLASDRQIVDDDPLGEHVDPKVEEWLDKRRRAQWAIVRVLKLDTDPPKGRAPLWAGPPVYSHRQKQKDT